MAKTMSMTSDEYASTLVFVCGEAIRKALGLSADDDLSVLLPRARIVTFYAYTEAYMSPDVEDDADDGDCDELAEQSSKYPECVPIGFFKCIEQAIAEHGAPPAVMIAGRIEDDQVLHVIQALLILPADWHDGLLRSLDSVMMYFNIMPEVPRTDLDEMSQMGWSIDEALHHLVRQEAEAMARKDEGEPKLMILA